METIVLSPVQDTGWKSVDIILENLRATYVEAFPTVKSLPIDSGFSEHITLQSAKEVIKLKPKRIVLLSNTPHPYYFLRCLNELIKRNTNNFQWPEIFIHVYGDFSQNLPLWYKTFALLEGRLVSLHCASTAQAQLVKLFTKEKDNIFCTPFPVDSLYAFSSEKREAERKKLGVGPNEIVFCYTGRISQQKNVLEMIEIISKFPQIKLIIAGTADDIGRPYIGKHLIPLEEQYKFNNALKANKSVLFLGNLNAQELHLLYNASDRFISLSLYNDEDFGMSPAEALCSGLPVMLTKWGGYKDFLDHVSNLGLDVKISKKGPSFNLTQLESLLESDILNSSSFTLSPEKRHLLSEHYISNLSPKALAQQISRCSNPPFGGASNFFKKVLMLDTNSLFKTYEGHYSSLYRRIYSEYI